MGMLDSLFRRASAPPETPAEPDAGADAARSSGPDPFELIIARQVLENHLQARHQELEADPSRIEGLPPEQVDLLIRAMAAAAHADGAVDPLEAARIERALAAGIADEAERERLRRAIEHPPCLESLVRQVNDDGTAARFYAVSVRAVRRGVSTNRAYLAYLANRLRLAPDLVVRVNRRFNVPLYVSPAR